MINHMALVKASALYQNYGYSYIEVPWRVSENISNLTKPEDVENMTLTTGKCLVASGEQGFLYLAAKGMLPFGKYQTITPCFRNDTHDSDHQKQFMKLELFEWLETHNNPFNMMQPRLELSKDVFCKVAKDVFNVGIQHDLTIKQIPVKRGAQSNASNESYDIMLTNDTELGSYGQRRCKFGSWIYGTGLAEPRFSRTIKDYYVR